MAEYETAHPPAWATNAEFESTNPYPIVQPGEQLTTQRGDVFRRRIRSRDVMLADVGWGDERPYVMEEDLPPLVARRVAQSPENENRMYGDKEINPISRRIQAEQASTSTTQVIRVDRRRYVFVQRRYIAPLIDPEEA